MQDWKAQQAARASAAKAMQAAFPHLVAVGQERGKNDSLNAAAKNMRIELARAFPGVKFSVKSSRFSGGDSITARWTDGPTTEQVDAIVDRYSAGSFDGMTDCYNYSRDAWTDAFGDAKYVSSIRDNSDKAIESAMRTVRAKYPGSVAKIEAAVPFTVAAYKACKLRSVPMFEGSCRTDDAESRINEEMARRTWALNKTPAAPIAEPEQVAA